MRSSSSMGQMLTPCHMSMGMALTAVTLGRTLWHMERELTSLSMPVTLPIIHTPNQTEMGESTCITYEYLPASTPVGSPPTLCLLRRTLKMWQICTIRSQTMWTTQVCLWSSMTTRRIQSTSLRLDDILELTLKAIIRPVTKRVLALPPFTVFSKTKGAPLHSLPLRSDFLQLLFLRI